MNYAKGDQVLRGKEPGTITMVKVVSDGRLRALVRFPEGHPQWGAYEQWNDVTELRLIRKRPHMKIDIKVKGLTTDQAKDLVAAAHAIEAVDGDADAPPAAPEHNHGAGRRQPTIDTAKMAAIASSNPARAPKPEKTGKGKKADVIADAADPEEEYEEEAPPPPKASAKRAPAPEPEEDEEEDIPHAEARAPAKKTSAAASTNGKHTNGTNGKGVRAAPPPEEDEDEDDGEEIADELKNARKHRDVLGYLMDNGFNDPADIKAECNRLKDKVGVLGRIGDLDSRIDRTLEVMDMGDATS